MSVSCNTHGLYFQHEDRCPLCTAESENARLTAEVERLTKEVARLEDVPIKCIWCGLRMATIDESSAHVLSCVKSPNHPLLAMVSETESLQDRIAALEAGIRAYQSEQENPFKDVTMIRVTRQRLFALLSPPQEGA